MFYILNAFLFLLLFIGIDSNNINYLLRIKSNDSQIIQCAPTMLPKNYALPVDKSNAKYDNVFYDTSLSVCFDSSKSFSQTPIIVINDVSRCGLNNLNKYASKKGAKMIIILSNQYEELPTVEVDIPVVLLRKKNEFEKISNMKLQATLYGQKPNSHRGNLLTTFCMVVIVIITIILTMLFTIFFHGELVRMTQMDQATESETKHLKWVIIVLPIMMIGVLLLSFFFYKVMVWIVIIMFFFLAPWLLAQLIILPIIKKNVFPKYVYPINKYGIKEFDLRLFIIYIICVIPSIVWIVNRKNSTGLVLNNIFGVFVCCNVSMVMGLVFAYSRKFRVLLLLLFVLLLMDAFMVYIPIIKKTSPNVVPTENQAQFSDNNSYVIRTKRASGGRSIMEQVVIGLSSNNNGEEMPIRFKMPYIGQQLSQCYSPAYSILGFGDLIIPGVFIVYILLYAVATKITAKIWLYSVVLFVSYICGLATTNIVLFFTQQGQPALIFLVPFVVLPTLITLALYYGGEDLQILWSQTSKWTSANARQPLQNDDELLDRSEGNLDQKFKPTPFSGDVEPSATIAPVDEK